jgi:hypothetical protein
MTQVSKNVKELYEKAKVYHLDYYSNQLRVQSEQIDKENKKNKVNGPIEIFEDFISYAEIKSCKKSTSNKDDNSYYFRMRLTPYELVLIIDLLSREHESKGSTSLKKEVTKNVLKKMEKHLSRFGWSRLCKTIDTPILHNLSREIDAVLNNVYPKFEKHYSGYNLPLGTTIETYKKFLKNFDTLENFKEFLNKRNADLTNISKQ